MNRTTSNCKPPATQNPSTLQNSSRPSRSKQLARQRGLKVEQLAAGWLQQQNLTLIKSNYHCRQGEIDLIMHAECDVLVFVEVKYRKQGLTQALESVTAKKQTRIIHAARHFLLCHPRFHSHNCRFDVLAVWQEAADSAHPKNKSTIISGKKLCFHWLENAFTL